MATHRGTTAGIALAALLLGACSTLVTHPPGSKQSGNALGPDQYAALEQGQPASLVSEPLSPGSPSDNLSPADPLDLAQNVEVSESSPSGQIPMADNVHVEKWVRYFTENRDRFQRYLERGSIYEKKVKEILREHRLPEELYFLALIESGFVVRARSRAGAEGIWQFIQATGRRYGMEVNHFVDQRRDVIRASHGASRYLKDLNNIFNDWYLAMAAYNAGERRVLRAILRSGSRDFWDLVRDKSLPRETRNYVPKFLAAWKIGKDPAKYGFQINRRPAYPEVQSLEVPSPIRLKEVARLSGVNYADLKEVNPHFRRGVTSPQRSIDKIWIPKDDYSRASRIVGQLSNYRLKSLMYPRGRRRAVASHSRGSGSVHRVRRGDTLSSISRRYGLSVRNLRSINGLRGNRIKIGQRIRVAQSHPTYRGRVPKQKLNRGLVKRANNPKLVQHRVRKGESLYRIASRYGVSIKKIKRANSLRKNQIFVGQRLTIPMGGRI